MASSKQIGKTLLDGEFCMEIAVIAAPEVGRE